MQLIQAFRAPQCHTSPESLPPVGPVGQWVRRALDASCVVRRALDAGYASRH